MTFAAMIMTIDNSDDDTDENDEMVLLFTDKSQLTVVGGASQLSNHSAYQCSVWMMTTTMAIMMITVIIDHYDHDDDCDDHGIRTVE